MIQPGLYNTSALLYQTFRDSGELHKQNAQYSVDVHIASLLRSQRRMNNTKPATSSPGRVGNEKPSEAKLLHACLQNFVEAFLLL